MATTLANISIKDSSSWNTYLNLIYPIGSYYLSNSSTSPGSRFGGTWTAITGRFLYCNSGTATGGSNNAIVVSHKHTASTSSAGSHAHEPSNSGQWNYGFLTYWQGGNTTRSRVCTEWWGDQYGHEYVFRSPSQGDLDYAGTTNSAGAHTHTVTVNSTGNSATNANMPQYRTCYCWYRTA